MTNKQAIEKLNDIRCHVKETSIEEQALVMAIEALKKAGIYGDIIYREDALMCLTGEYPADFKHDELIAKFIRRIRKLPSAQPEQNWIPCSETVDIPDHEVMACDRYGEFIIGYLDYKDEQWICESDDSLMYDPVAWCELPKPYKEGGADG